MSVRKRLRLSMNILLRMIRVGLRIMEMMVLRMRMRLTRMIRMSLRIMGRMKMKLS